MAQFYDYINKKSYKELNFSCKKCDWSGTGKEAAEDFGSSSGFPILCPKCHWYIEWIDVMVSLDELLEYGTEKDKAHARERMDFWNNWREASLKSHEQLPDIDENEIIITLREEEKPHTGKIDDADIVLYWKHKELWRETRLFEYYGRYLELGEILKEKYGQRLIDFEAEETWALGGDSIRAFDKVREFRASLTDSFFDKNRQYGVLIEQYKKHGKIIVAYDFDDTVSPFRGSDCGRVVQLLRDLRPYAHLICFTARELAKLGEIEEYLKLNNIPYDYINKEFDGSEIAGKKLYYNQLLDDKAGLHDSYLILKRFLNVARSTRRD